MGEVDLFGNASLWVLYGLAIKGDLKKVQVGLDSRCSKSHKCADSWGITAYGIENELDS